MTMKVPDVVVRAYDLGGFGDIAGAMRVASFLNRQGLDVKIKGTSRSAIEKLKLLKPDVEYGNGEITYPDTIQVDVAGHYGDDRNRIRTSVPHQFTEDMDNPSDRRKRVPLYLKSGLKSEMPNIPLKVKLGDNVPMFYRPYREGDLPKPGERSPKELIIRCIEEEGNASRQQRDVIEQMDRIGFAHFSPEILGQDPRNLFLHPYFKAIQEASRYSSEKFGLGVFVNKDLERKIISSAFYEDWNAIGSDGQRINRDPKFPTLMFIGPKPQRTVSGLFLSSDIPNLVTGDLSLSDALYGLIAMDGPMFYYETPGWKMPTFIELANILNRRDSELSGIFVIGSNHCERVISKEEQESKREVISQLFNGVTCTFLDKKVNELATNQMRRAVRDEIRRRFGDVQVCGNLEDGYYIPPGVPYLFQDATAHVVETLRDDPDLLAETEKARRFIANGSPISINIQTGVLEPQLNKNGSSKEGIESLLDFSEYNIKEYSFYKKKGHYKVDYQENMIFHKKNNYMGEYQENIIFNKKKDYLDGLGNDMIIKNDNYIGSYNEKTFDNNKMYKVIQFPNYKQGKGYLGKSNSEYN